MFDGIGNSYTDEILHAARLSPIMLTSKLDDDDVARLHEACVAGLANWTERLRKHYGDAFPEQATAFHQDMAVHRKYGQPCPVCGEPIQRIVYASRENNYCPACQTGRKLLADRGLSRLLAQDWPRSLEELELETRRETISVAWYASAGHFDEPRIGRRSDEVFERGENFRGYRAVPSVIDYLLVAHDRVRVGHYTRGRDDTWVLREHGPGSRRRPASGAGEIAIDEIYRKVSSLDHLPVSVSTRSSYVLDERHGPAGLASRSAG